MKRQHSKLRTPENASRVCELLAEGQSLRQIARELGCDNSAIAHWVREDGEAGERAGWPARRANGRLAARFPALGSLGHRGPRSAPFLLFGGREST